MSWLIILLSLGSILATILTIIKYIKQIGDLIKFFVGLFKNSKIKNLKNHKIFENIDDAIRDDKLLQVPSSVRNQVALELKNKKLITYKKKIFDFVNIDIKKMENDKIINNAKDLLIESMYESNKEFKRLSINKEEEKTADMIINKYKYFEARQIENVFEILNEYKYEKIKHDELMKIILSSYQYIITDIINNTKETLSKINGDLTGLYFMGKIIEAHDDKI